MEGKLFAAIRRDRDHTPAARRQAVIGTYPVCLEAIRRWGGADGRQFVLGQLIDLLDFFIDGDAPETRVLFSQIAQLDHAGSERGRRSTDATGWLRGTPRRDLGVLLCLARLATEQGGLPGPVGEELQAQIGAMLRAQETAH